MNIKRPSTEIYSNNISECAVSFLSISLLSDTILALLLLGQIKMEKKIFLITLAEISNSKNTYC